MIDPFHAYPCVSEQPNGHPRLLRYGELKDYSNKPHSSQVVLQYSSFTTEVQLYSNPKSSTAVRQYCPSNILLTGIHPFLITYTRVKYLYSSILHGLLHGHN